MDINNNNNIYLQQHIARYAGNDELLAPDGRRNLNKSYLQGAWQCNYHRHCAVARAWIFSKSRGIVRPRMARKCWVLRNALCNIKKGNYIRFDTMRCSCHIYLRLSARVSREAKWGAVVIYYGVPRKSVAQVWQKDLFRFLPIRARRY